MLYERIKLLRKKKGLSQEELAAQLHVVRQTISKWERGYSIPDAEMLTRLACALDVSVDELLGTTAESPEEKARLANELAQINEKLAQKDRQSKRVIKIFAVVIVLSIILRIIWVCWGISGMRKAKNFPAYVTIDGIEQEVDPRNTPIETDNAQKP